MATMPAFNRYQQPIYNRNKGATPMNKEEPKDLQAVIEKVRNLLDLTHRTGFKTSRSIGQLLANLSPDELAKVNEALKQ